jgi:hypothetical protein
MLPFEDVRRDQLTARKDRLPVELRRFNRAPLQQALHFTSKGDAGEGAPQEGLARDICLGGMFLETATPAEFGAAVVVHVKLPGEKVAFALPAIVRWTRAGGMGVQFQNLGARETFAITEIVRKHDAGG